MTIKKIFSGLFIAATLLFSVVLFRTFSSEVAPTEVKAVSININTKQSAQHLAKAIQFQTVTFQNPQKINKNEFTLLHAYLKKTYPLIHSSLKQKTIGDLSLLYTWQGQDNTLKPILLMAHQDVVPVTDGTEDNWLQPPFSGNIADGYIWGRGSMDMKGGLIGIMEAVETLLKEGFQPKRTIMLAFGHDEEGGGTAGAKKIADYLATQNSHFEYVLDEGGFISKGIVPGVSEPVAMIGISEKGIVSLKLTVETEGGHSSMPGRHTSVGILSKAITELEDHLFPINAEYAENLLSAVAPKMPFIKRMIFSNLWLFRPLVLPQLEKSRSMNAMIRTTTAATMISGSKKENILPIKATAIVNFRILPGETIASVFKYVKKTISEPNVKVGIMTELKADPSPLSSTHSKGYQTLTESILQVAPKNTLVVPFILVGASDSRYFTGISDNVYRFIFNQLNAKDLKRFHGTNERILAKEYEQTVMFYYQLLRNSQNL